MTFNKVRNSASTQVRLLLLIQHINNNGVNVHYLFAEIRFQYFCHMGFIIAMTAVNTSCFHLLAFSICIFFKFHFHIGPNVYEINCNY